jgi:serine/threonine protein phosphatase 1
MSYSYLRLYYRGPASKEVLDLILKLKEKGYHVQCLLGNHAVMMLDVLQNPTSSEAYIWKAWNGGEATLNSFRAISVSEVDQKYVDFIRSMPCFIEKPPFIFVHAGLNFNIPSPLSDEETMLWSFEDKPVVDKE